MNKLKIKLVAEIGCNHKGNLKIAKKMIETAKSCGADYVKFQKRDNKFLLGDAYNLPHPVSYNSYGESYGKHRDFLEFQMSDHYKLYKHCEKFKIKYAVSVWEKNSALDYINSKIKLDYIKVPSACNTDFELLNFLIKNFKKKIHISLGMTSKKEILEIFNLFKKNNRNKDLVLYACTSDYPVKNKDIKLLDITNLKNKFKNKVNAIAFSGHHLGIAHDIAAVTLGAQFIERHFTLDRTWKGTDHAASLEPQGLKKLSRDIASVISSLDYKRGDGILNCEKQQRKKLKRIIK